MKMKTNGSENSMAQWSEPEVIRRAQMGESAAFEWLYNTHSKRVYNILLGLLKNTAEAEDLTQQVFLRLFRNISMFRGESAFSTWLHRVAVNTALTFLRRKKLTEAPNENADGAGADENDQRESGAADTSMLGVVGRIHLSRAIKQLPSSWRQVLLLHDVIGFEHGEIARRLGCSAGSSRAQLHRVRKQLRRVLLGEPGHGEINVTAQQEQF
jgi:RNA polymerase sigma-70 factor (ECF subfamily)